MVDLALIETVSYIVGALGVFIAAVFYVLNLRISQRNQKLTLDLRKGDLIQKYSSQMSTRDIQAAYHDVVWAQDFSNYREWTEKYGTHNAEAYQNFVMLTNLVNSWGLLYEEKLFDIETLEKLSSKLAIMVIWRKVMPVIKEWRMQYGDPSFMLPMEHYAEAVSKRNPEIYLKMQAFLSSSPSQ
jgi:hypothetical protein